MNQWQERLAAHPVHGTLQNAQTTLDAIKSDELPTEGADIVLRAATLLACATKALEEADPILVSVSHLDVLQKQANALHNKFTSFAADKNASHLAGAIPHLDAIAGVLPMLQPPVEGEVRTAAVITLHETAEAMIRGLREQAGQVRTALDLVQKEAGERTDDVQGLADAVEAQKTRLDTIVAEFQGQFSEAEDRRRQSFDASGKELTAEFRSLLDKTDTNLQQYASQSSEKADAVITALEKQKQNAIKLLQVIGNIGATGNFKGIADAERKSANRFRVVTLVCMALIIVGIGSTVWVATSEDSKWQQVALRLGITLALALPAWYASRESSSHRRFERRNRVLELELASVDAYLESLPEAQRHQLKAELTARFFGQTNADFDPESESGSVPSIEIAKLAVERSAKSLDRAIDKLSK